MVLSAPPPPPQKKKMSFKPHQTQLVPYFILGIEHYLQLTQTFVPIIY